MPLRFAHAGDFHLDDDRYFATHPQPEIDLTFSVSGGQSEAAPGRT